jgi:predicted nuclease of predicted toxin-antitoxin system
MKFLVDECTGPAVAQWLKDQGHNVFSVYDESRGITDDEVVKKAYTEERILVTNDKDFGEKIYREKRPHTGVILLRLEDERANNKIIVIQQLLESYSDRLHGNFLVVTEEQVRIARI